MAPVASILTPLRHTSKRFFSTGKRLALQGYVVVAPDYVALGISKTNDGEDITLQYLANSAAANDVVYAVQAAQQAFAKLSSDFVVIGHSQGGGAAWGVAERQAVTPIKGYLGAIAVSPVTNILELPVSDNPLIPLLAVYMVPTMQDLYPNFDPREFFTEGGLASISTGPKNRRMHRRQRNAHDGFPSASR